ncbi:MAG: hypothetical protein AUG81_07940 [Verrucomicrobia bacterium 13_1_20CM_4_54_11]|nr:MAG: hypothetical protein AUG81_07940 [Verrucomicrobia bacterium 13_1_20CM_4_54_11]
MQKPRFKLRIEDLTTSDEAMARCLQLAALSECSQPTRGSSAHQTARCGNECGRENSGKTFISV